jgi:hypothetical protein
MLLVGAAIIASTGGRTAEAGLVQGQIVPEAPRTDVPVVLDGKVLAHAKVGTRVFVGGDFQQVELIDGTIITQPFLFAYDVNTGVLDPTFRPVLNKLVRSLEPTAAGDGLYVGGLFSSWDASFPLRIAKLDAQGNLDLTFDARASARVQSIVEVGDSVYIGGDFLDVSGTPATGLVKVDRITGAVDTNFNFTLGASIIGSQLVRRVKATPDGSALFVLHYGSTVNGEIRRAVAKMDLVGTPTLSGWTVPWLEQTNDKLCWDRLRDMAIAPDGSFIVIGGQGADNPPNCDSVLKYSTAGNGVVNFDWSARMYSSVYSIAVSDVAVYVGGHFCAAPKNPIPPGGVSSTWTGTANGCDVNDPLNPVNPSQRDPDNAVFRKQIAALDPSTGQALAWSPGSNNFTAVYDLTLVDRGLLAGHDRDRFNDVGTGRSGFFDLGGAGDIEAPVLVTTEPTPGAVISDPTLLAGSATDNEDVTSVTIRLKNITTDQWLQLDGTLGAGQVDLPVTIIPTGLGEVTWSYPVANLPIGDYEIRGFATDPVGNTSTPLVSPFAIPGAVSCTVVLGIDDQPVVSWTGFDFNGVSSVYIRRDGSYLATGGAGSSSYTDTAAAPGDRSYVVRWRPGGVVTDIPCSPDPITVPEGGPTLTCSAGLNAESKPVLNWTAVAGISKYSIREAASGWIASLDGVTTYTDSTATPGDYNYIIRYKQQGANVDTPCAPSPLTVPGGGGAACTVLVDGNGDVVVNWTLVPGVGTYVIRDLAVGWIATVENDTTYTDTDPEAGARTYVLRYWNPGRTDLTCEPDPIIIG